MGSTPDMAVLMNFATPLSFTENYTGAPEGERSDADKLRQSKAEYEEHQRKKANGEVDPLQTAKVTFQQTAPEFERSSAGSSNRYASEKALEEDLVAQLDWEDFKIPWLTNSREDSKTRFIRALRNHVVESGVPHIVLNAQDQGLPLCRAGRARSHGDSQRRVSSIEQPNQPVVRRLPRLAFIETARAALNQQRASSVELAEGEEWYLSPEETGPVNYPYILSYSPSSATVPPMVDRRQSL
ncbi:hypothetical protein HDK64DRAFT_302697 [Phyllosticta capitalensis]